jgi:hypothetical protein
MGTGAVGLCEGKAEGALLPCALGGELPAGVLLTEPPALALIWPRNGNPLLAPLRQCAPVLSVVLFLQWTAQMKHWHEECEQAPRGGFPPRHSMTEEVLESAAHSRFSRSLSIAFFSSANLACTGKEFWVC